MDDVILVVAGVGLGMLVLGLMVISPTLFFIGMAAIVVGCFLALLFSR